MSRQDRARKGPTIFAAAVIAASSLLSTPALAHPGSAIAVDRLGQVYFIDTGDGVWKIDTRGKLIHLGGPRFHWMAIDLDNRFGNARLPTGTGGTMTRVGDAPGLIVSSDFPITIGRDGNLYYPQPRSGGGVQIIRYTPAGVTSVLATIPTSGSGGRLEHLNDLASAPDGSLYFSEDKAVRRVTMDGRVTTIATNVRVTQCSRIPGMTESLQPSLRGLAIDAAGSVYAAASGCGSVVKITSSGSVTTLVEMKDPWSPTAVALRGNDVFSLEYIHTETEDSGSRRAWIPRVRLITGASSVVVATVERR